MGGLDQDHCSRSRTQTSLLLIGTIRGENIMLRRFLCSLQTVAIFRSVNSVLRSTATAAGGLWHRGGSSGPALRPSLRGHCLAPDMNAAFLFNNTMFNTSLIQHSALYSTIHQKQRQCGGVRLSLAIY
ncbi:hypothetical protein EYF80_004186 [Liparis tanakae]|uniref:Uncharacterized protein n=1 Tax=Liparis tanakae TaxID=230148 RepID=A0A4Z2J7G9_9TELE|nr:hypothetical protein EYF80_004186 [Liparis tanakae]